MFYFLSKYLPLFIYPLGLSCLLLTVSLLLRRSPNWQMRIIALVLIILWLGGNQWATMLLLRSLEWQHMPAADIPRGDVIIVLGGATHAQSYPRPTHELNEAGDRLWYAAWLYKQGAAPKILVSGGSGEWVGPNLGPEAEAMAYFLSNLGVPQEAIIWETRSRNTYENAVESLHLLQDRPIKRIILITSAIHMPRARRIFERYAARTNPAWQIIPVPTDFILSQADWEYFTRPDPLIQFRNLLPRADNLNHTTDVLKEYIGIVIYRLRGWL